MCHLTKNSFYLFNLIINIFIDAGLGSWVPDNIQDCDYVIYEQSLICCCLTLYVMSFIFRTTSMLASHCLGIIISKVGQDRTTQLNTSWIEEKYVEWVVMFDLQGKTLEIVKNWYLMWQILNSLEEKMGYELYLLLKQALDTIELFLCFCMDGAHDFFFFNMLHASSPGQLIFFRRLILSGQKVRQDVYRQFNFR